MFLVLLGGCAAPLQTYSTDRPASISAGLRQAGVADGRRDFRSVFCSLLARDLAPAEARCDHWLVALSDEIIVSPPTAHALAPISPSVDIVFVGGIFGECLGERVELFGDAKQVIASAGYRTSAAPVRGRAGSDVNAEIIRSHILGLADSQRKILLIAYSKGASDALTALAQYPELRPRIAALLSVAGVVNGSPLADDLSRVYDGLFADIPFNQCPVTDRDEVDSLTKRRRFDWLIRNAPPSGIAYFSIVATPEPDKVSRLLRPFYRKLAFIDPLNDGQLLFSDAVIPGSRLLAYMNADHWAIALPFNEAKLPFAATLLDKNYFPRSQMIEAAVREIESALHVNDPPDPAAGAVFKNPVVK